MFEKQKTKLNNYNKIVIMWQEVKSVRKKWLVLGVVVLSLLSLFGCEKKNIEINDIVSFDFGYSTGTHMDASVKYELEFEDGVYTAYIKPDGVGYEERIAYVVDENFAKELEGFLKENKVNRWNGFRKSTDWKSF